MQLTKFVLTAPAQQLMVVEQTFATLIPTALVNPTRNAAIMPASPLPALELISAPVTLLANQQLLRHPFHNQDLAFPLSLQWEQEQFLQSLDCCCFFNGNN